MNIKSRSHPERQTRRGRLLLERPTGVPALAAIALLMGGWACVAGAAGPAGAAEPQAAISESLAPAPAPVTRSQSALVETGAVGRDAGQGAGMVVVQVEAPAIPGQSTQKVTKVEGTDGGVRARTDLRHDQSAASSLGNSALGVSSFTVRPLR